MPQPRKSVEADINRAIDDLIHPYITKYPYLIVVDGVLHALVEQNPNISLKNFIRYNTKFVLRKLTTTRKPMKKTSAPK